MSIMACTEEKRAGAETAFLNSWGLHADSDRPQSFYNGNVYNEKENLKGFILLDQAKIKIIVSLANMTVEVAQKDGNSLVGTIKESSHLEPISIIYSYNVTEDMHCLIDTKNGAILELSPSEITASKRTDGGKDKLVNYKTVELKADGSNSSVITSEEMLLVSSTLTHFKGLVPQFFEMVRFNGKPISEYPKLKQLLI